MAHPHNRTLLSKKKERTTDKPTRAQYIMLSERCQTQKSTYTILFIEHSGKGRLEGQIWDRCRQGLQVEAVVDHKGE